MTVEQQTIAAAQQPDELTPGIKVAGELMGELPADLYIPPDALQVILESFEGPLDLLLYLIKKQNLDILDIPVLEITKQYMAYISVMQVMHFELAAEYLLMAATLAQIKSRLLLPRPELDTETEEDPRLALVRQLQEYEVFKAAARSLDECPRSGRDFQPVATRINWQLERAEPQITLEELIQALNAVNQRGEVKSHHQIQREALSVRETMIGILALLTQETFCELRGLFPAEKGKAGVVVTVLAILELAKESMIEIVQNDLFAPVHIRAV